MEFRTLGPLEVVDDGRVVAIEGGVRRRLLCALFASAGRPMPYASLLRAGWADDPPPTARRTAQSHVSRLRALGLGIDGVVGGYLLVVDPGQVDAHRFRTFCEDRAFDGASVEELREVLGWWRGEAWVDLAETMPLAASQQLDEYRQAVEEQIVSVELASGRPWVVADAEKLVLAAPGRERRWALWAVSLYRDQRRREAFDVLDRARRGLGEAGLIPGALLEQVEAAVVQGRPAPEAVALLHDDGAPPTATPRLDGSTRRHGPTLPNAAAASFVGRDRELRLLDALLGTERLVSITGAGGVGKTRLAIEVMERSAAERSGHAWFCELAPVANPAAVAHAVATALGVVANTSGALRDAIARFLGRHSGILVLDNCEHLLDAVADLVEVLLATPGDFVILATSREPLGLGEEQVLPLTPLDPASDDAMSLFFDRARRVLGNWEPTEAERDDVQAICVALDGIPLGVELAAAQVRSMSTAEIRKHLQESVSLLHSRIRRVARHQTLDDATRWSHELLDPGERQVFAQLSVFAGGFTTTNAHAVLSSDDPRSVVELLDGLVAKALLEVRDRTHITRYRMLEPIRQYAATKLLDIDTADVTRNRHGEHFARHAAGRAQDTANALDLDNLRAALDWLTDQGNVELALHLAHGVGAAALAQQHLEVGEWCAKVIDLSGAPEHPLGPQVAGLAAHFCYQQGRFEDAWQLVHAAEAMPTYSADRLYPASTHAVLHWFRGDVDAALAQLDGIDVSSPMARLVVNWYRVIFCPTGSGTDGALDALAALSSRIPQARSWYLGARAAHAISSDSPAEAMAAADALWQHAAERGTELDRYQAIGARVGAAVRFGTIDEDLLEEFVAAMTRMRDTGHNSRRWILLKSASNILWRHGDQTDAALIRAGVALGPWHPAYFARWDDPCLVEAAGVVENEARSLSLDDLTDRAIDALERVIVHLEESSVR